MVDKNTCFYVILLLNVMAVSSYLQFVVPGVTHADSSPVHVSQFEYGPYPYWPNRTVDGNFSQNIRACLHTATQSNILEAWLRIDLQTVRSIKSVKIWYRNDRGSVAKSTERLRGHSIRVSNSSDVPPGSTDACFTDGGSASMSTVRLRGYSIRVSNSSDIPPGSTDACFTDDMSHTLPTVIQEDCKKTTRYVWFYQPKVRSGDDKVPVLEICEVQIFGCETGTYGFSCLKNCRHCKSSETCDIDTGECDGDGCALPGFKSPMCSECISGLYGNECNFKCSQFCIDQLCYGATGECVNGCEDGYIGGLCKTRCPNGYFGRKCLETCGKCLDDRTCDNVNGTCMDGCNEGFKGDLCKIGCSPGEYGQNCQFRCSDHCHNNEVCNSFFGNCSKCEIGFQNAKCNEQCDDGNYGESCMFQCGHCLDDITCNNINGTCPGGCMSGWQNTDKCDKQCRNGTFGVRCTHTCTENCLNNEICNKSDGGCRNCAPGWEGHLCDKTCGIGQYGLKCQHNCGHCFKAEQCFHTNGSCSGGCVEGYRGEMCSESSVGSTQDPTMPFIAVISILVVIIVVLITIIAVGVVILRNARKTNKANSKVNEIDMYDSPTPKPENNVYDIISTS